MLREPQRSRISRRYGGGYMGKRKKRDFEALGASALASAGRLADQDRELEEIRGQKSYVVQVLRVDQVKERANLETRALKPQLILELFYSISAIGLIEPLAVDNRYRLLAGGHRLTALRLLSLGKEEAQERFAELEPKQEQQEAFERILAELSGEIPKEVPVHIFDFDSKKEPERALEIETAENAVRRDYTPKEVFTLYKRMEGMRGYTTRTGRPRLGERAVVPELAAILGKSTPTVNRYIRKAQEAEESTQHPEEARLRRARRVYTDLKRLADKLRREAKRSEELHGLLELFEGEQARRVFSQAEESLSVSSEKRKVDHLI